MADQLTGEVTELLQALIRNRCVNDGTPESGRRGAQRRRCCETTSSGAGIDVERFEPHAGPRARSSPASRAPTPTRRRCCLMGHTDVVPVTPPDGRATRSAASSSTARCGAVAPIDMLNLTASMAVAVRAPRRAGLPAEGHADLLRRRRRGGAAAHGRRVDGSTTSATPSRADYVLTESGGLVSDGPAGAEVVVTVGEKGGAWRRLRVHGTPGHGSTPFGADNALVKAAEVVRRSPSTARQPRSTTSGGPMRVARPRRRDPRSAASTRRGLGRVPHRSPTPASPSSPTPARTPRSRPMSSTAAPRPT